MKRSSSKLITRARSVRNMGKIPFKFRFDFLIETVEKIAASGDIVVILERKHKTDSTTPAKVDRATRKATFGNEKLSANITLFKISPSDKKFLDKVFKIAVKANNLEGKTLGKIHLNLADYAEVPSGSKRIGAELSNGASLIASIQCTFVSMGKVTRGKNGELGGHELDDSDGEEDDMDKTDSDLGASFNMTKFSQKLVRTGSKKAVRREKHHKDDDAGGTGSAEAEKYRRENIRLRKQLEEMEKSPGRVQSGSSEMDSLQHENKRLRRRVEELEMSLSREPGYREVVKELKEVKMALALLHLEKEKVSLELQRYQRGEVSPTDIFAKR